MENQYISKIAMSKIIKFLKMIKSIYIKSIKNIKKFIQATFWIIRTGAQWRELPKHFGAWNSVFKRFNAWCKKGIWEAMHMHFIEDPDLENIMFDSTVVRANACAAGYTKGSGEEEALGRSVGGFSTKVHAKTDALGYPLKFVLSPGQDADITHAPELIKGSEGSNGLGDKGYDSDPFREQLLSQNCTPVIPYRSNRKNKQPYDEHTYKDRFLIECLFSKMKYFRRVFSRFEKTKRNYHSVLSFVGALLWLR